MAEIARIQKERFDFIQANGYSPSEISVSPSRLADMLLEQWEESCFTGDLRSQYKDSADWIARGIMSAMQGKTVICGMQVTMDDALPVSGIKLMERKNPHEQLIGDALDRILAEK
jgi:hypothetical protein